MDQKKCSWCHRQSVAQIKSRIYTHYVCDDISCAIRKEHFIASALSAHQHSAPFVTDRFISQTLEIARLILQSIDGEKE